MSASHNFETSSAAKVSYRNYFQDAVPCRLNLFSREIYLIWGPLDINLLWKHSNTFTPKAVQLVGMQNILKLGPSGASFCDSDDSGRGPRPHPKSQVKPENRLWFHTHDTSAIFLSGNHLQTIVKNFQPKLRARIEELPIDSNWNETADLYQFIYDTLFPIQVQALFGTSFLALNPNFAQDFRKFHQGLVYFLRGSPSWLIPTAWAARERCLESIKRWHLFLLEQESNQKPAHSEENNFLFGSRYIRTLQEKYGRMKPLDADAIASSELGVIWA